MTTTKDKQKTIEIARTLFDKQNDVSYCNSEIGIYEIKTLEQAVKFLNWVLQKDVFEYEFKK